MNNDYIISKVKEYFPEVIKLRRHIHQNPELSYQEFETANFIRHMLNEYGIDYKILATTGTVATIGHGNKCVALRADIDALPIVEETELEFASLKKGVMHACGHDMHTSMLLAACKILKDNERLLNGVIKVIFQPAEEKIPGGAIEMIEQGVLENPVPDVIFAQHIYPGATSGTISVVGGPTLASADELYWTITGKSAHAAQPHLSSDAILAASQLIVYYQSILTKFKNPLDSGVLSVTAIHGGSATNVFPDEVKMMGTFRAYNDKWRHDTHKLLKENSDKVAQLYGCKCDLEILNGYPPLINDPSVAEFIRNIASDLFGKDNTLDFEPKMWAEDFAYYAQKIPACFWLLGVIPEELSVMPPLHNSKLNPSESAMVNGISMLVSASYNFLEGFRK